jgi:hypothetical protein
MMIMIMMLGFNLEAWLHANFPELLLWRANTSGRQKRGPSINCAEP